MTYQNRDLIRKPLCMLRPNEEQREKLLRLAQRRSNGGHIAPTLLDALLEMADQMEIEEERRHAPNPISRGQLDRNVFGGLIAA
ncbi:MAG: hypothetical protein LBJ15_19515 [Comamonas sp.]|jgi:hypothetical protein|uniref:hypothetical protein n=1 Tax=Comamonas sp. TaxID=34028 RepID=UPI002831E665|nr:hypothetical protein [Comamonas sp.]MDR0216164.1 hypothetical protein [Comamonas sp.]